MSIGTTIVDVAADAWPVVGALGGVWLGHRTERWKHTHDLDAAIAQQAHERERAARSAQESAVARVVEAGLTWCRDIAAATNAMSQEQPERSGTALSPVLESHAAFGQAVFAAELLFGDDSMLRPLSQLADHYEDGFGLLYDLAAASSVDE